MHAQRKSLHTHTHKPYIPLTHVDAYTPFPLFGLSGELCAEASQGRGRTTHARATDHATTLCAEASQGRGRTTHHAPPCNNAVRGGLRGAVRGGLLGEGADNARMHHGPAHNARTHHGPAPRNNRVRDHNR